MLQFWAEAANVSAHKVFSYIKACLAVNNYSGLRAIHSALGSAAIRRLKRTWAHAKSRTEKSLDYFNKLFDSTKNSACYFEKINSVGLPCLPFLGISDLLMS